MFTGIVTQMGQVSGIRPGGGGGLRLTIAPATPLATPALGESIAVSGVCLTLVSHGPRALEFDVVPETLRKTTLGALGPGASVNLERALRVGDPLGGHIVQGHVDGVAWVKERGTQQQDVRLVVSLPPELDGSVIAKGSVTLDGVSLTVGEVWSQGGSTSFSVYLVPHTLRVTTLGAAAPGQRLNVEVDVMGRWVAHHLARMGLAPPPDGAGPTPPGSR